MTSAAVWMVLGLGVGFGVAFAIRRFLPAWRKGRQTATLPVYASRQELRKAMRQRKKKQQAVRKGD
jgi:hypothetical protein